jgi:uncharacterized membrane protein YtjA (UPF0391 family)
MAEGFVGLAPRSLKSGNGMLYWAMIFFIITIFAALFGFTTIAVGSASIAKIFFVVFLVLFAFSLTLGGVRRRGPHS